MILIKSDIRATCLKEVEVAADKLISIISIAAHIKDDTTGDAALEYLKSFL